MKLHSVEHKTGNVREPGRALMPLAAMPGDRLGCGRAAVAWAASKHDCAAEAPEGCTCRNPVHGHVWVGGRDAPIARAIRMGRSWPAGCRAKTCLDLEKKT